MREQRPISAAQTPKGFRLDIQGIRGFALILVLACHAKLPFAAGGFVGLDIFYVLSGFLITGLLVTEAERTGTVSIRDFYARRARRLLPMVVTVLGVTGAGALVLFDTARIHEVSGDIVAAALYFANWRFMAESVDYFAFDDKLISPVQHYWSLSVEEQFYVLWPLLVVGASFVAARWSAGRRPMLFAVVAAVSGASLVYSVWFTGVDPQQSYFSTLTRIWEIGVGAGLALILPAGLRLPRAVSAVLAGGGIATLAITTVVFTASTPYPGWEAILPVAATAAVIVAGTANVLSLPIRALTIAPLQYLGKISYAWYLWHWPALVFAAAIWGPLSVRESVLVTLASWVPTIISHHLIEERFRRSRELARRPRRALAIGFACTTVAVFVGLSLVVLRPGLPTAPDSAVAGARVSHDAPLQRKAIALRPIPSKAKDDKGQLFDDGCLTKGKARTSKSCVYGHKDGKKTVIVFGDSHALQYTPAIRRIARKRGWRMIGLMRASCPIGDIDYQPTCNAWRANTLKRIERIKPDLVVTASATDKRFRVKVDGDRLSRTASEPLLEAGYARTFRRLMRTGARVAVIRDQARAPFDVAGCVSEHADDLERCAFRPKRNARFAFDARGARKAGRRVKVIDPMDVLCPKRRGHARRCPAVVGNALVYRDTYHVSATFSRTLDRWLAPRLPAMR